MKRAARLVLRALLVSLLLAAVFDLPLPAASRERRRLHLVDRSASVSLGGGAGPRLRDADAIVAFDRARAPGEVLFASFAGDVRFESTVVERPESSRIGAALEAALGRDPTEIVLHSDGRGELGAALLLCRARGVPVHVVPLGPIEVRDVRVLRARAPGDAAPGERFPVEITLTSTFPVRARARLGDAAREVELSPGAPATLVFDGRGPGEHPFVIESEDDVPQNNRLLLRVLERSARRRVVAWPGERAPELKDVDLLRGAAELAGAHALVVDGPLPVERARAAARFAREGGGLLLLAEAPIEGPLEDVAPVLPASDQRVALVFAVDVSGSMKERFDPLLRAVEETRDLLRGELLIPMAFSDTAEFVDWRELPRKSPTGATNFVPALRAAQERLRTERGRKHILLFTDGQASEDERPAEREAAWKALEDIGLTVLTVDRELDIAQPNVKIGRMEELAPRLSEIFSGLSEKRRERPGPLDLHPHPVTAGLAGIEPAWLRLTSAKPEAQIAASWGRPPAVYPALAFARAGHGIGGAVLFPADPAVLSRALAHVARPNAGPYRLSVEPPLVRARGPAGPPRLKARANGVEFELLQVRSDLWEGRLPETGAGSVLVELLEGGMASAVVPCPPEYERTGLDLEALEEIATSTGGRLLRSSAELAALPPPTSSGTPRRGRSMFLWAALLALFAELGVSTFWKTR